MLNKTMRGLFFSIFLLGGVAFADGNPTLHQVYQAAQAGKLDEAQGMMEQVLRDHPGSGKAHYVEAEILAKQGRLSNAEAELKTAERLEPGLPFAKPQAVQELKSRIAGGSPPSYSSANGLQAKTPNAFPWGLLLLGIAAIVVITLIMKAISARNTLPRGGNYQPGMPASGGQPFAAGQPNAGGVGPMAPAGGGLGSGIMSGLATGAAVGAGMVAVEALAHHFMDGNRGGSGAVPAADTWNSSANPDLGGADFGVVDNSSWDDSSGIADSADLGGDDWS